MINAVYVSLVDPQNRDAWSGSAYWAARGLKNAGFNLEFIGPLANRHQLFTRIKGRVINHLGWNYSPYGETLVLKSFARQVECELRNKVGSVIISCGRPHLAYLNTQLPYIFFDDGSTPAMNRDFPGMAHLWPSNLRNLYYAERRVLERCLYACYASEWAASGAIKYYGDSIKGKVKVIPWGANMEVTRTRTEVDSIIQKRGSAQCRLLFVGIDWNRKGGVMAVAVAEHLHRQGISVQIDIVGCKPEGVFPPFVKIHGYISKQTPEGARFIDQLYREAHFFIMPSESEPYGIVYVEAASYGLPAVGKDCAGPATIIQNGRNGYIFSNESPPSVYADKLEEIWRDRAAYESLCRSSFQEYESRLNWKTFGEAIYDLVKERV